MTVGRDSRAPRKLRIVLLTTASLVVVALLAVTYAAAGWHRMADVCSTDAAVPDGVIGSYVQYDWSWLPPGFTCTWDGEVSTTKLWW